MRMHLDTDIIVVSPKPRSCTETTVVAPADYRLNISVTSENQPNLDYTFLLIKQCLFERENKNMMLIDKISKGKEFCLQFPKPQQNERKQARQWATTINKQTTSRRLYSPADDAQSENSQLFMTKTLKTLPREKEQTNFAAIRPESKILTRDNSPRCASSLTNVCQSGIKVMHLENSEFDLPSNWSAMDRNENLKLVSLNSSDEEYIEVEQQFRSWKDMHHKSILQIERIQNRYLYEQYIAKKKFMDSHNQPGQDNESTLWHGTDIEAINSINTYGFNRNYCGKNAAAYGNGVYFAVDPSYSAKNTYARPDFSRIKRIYLCKVLVGDYTKGHHGMKVPPPKAMAAGFHVLYDSVVDNPKSPMIFVIFHDAQAYPTYLVSFDD